MQQIPQHITSIPGIGLATDAAILGEIRDVNRFESPEKLVAYAGINATVYQYGEFETRETHMSKSVALHIFAMSSGRLPALR